MLCGRRKGVRFDFLRAPSLAEGGSGSLTSLQSSCEALEVWKRVDADFGLIGFLRRKALIHSLGDVPELSCVERIVGGEGSKLLKLGSV